MVVLESGLAMVDPGDAGDTLDAGGGQVLGLGASSGDRTIVAWSDTRNGDALTGTQDIVTAALGQQDAGARPWMWFGLGGATGAAVGAGLAAWVLLLVVRKRWRGPDARVDDPPVLSPAPKEPAL